MAVTPKQLANLKPIKKGEVRNPDGARRQNPEMKKLKSLTEQEMIEVGSLVVKGSLKELRAIKDDPDASILKCMIASVALKTISSGNASYLDTLLNRLVGKPKQTVQLDTQVNNTVNIIPREVAEQALLEIQKDVTDD